MKKKQKTSFTHLPLHQSPVAATPALKSPPHSHLKNASRLKMSTVFAEENTSPNETAYIYSNGDDSSMQSSFGSTPGYPSPAHNTPFYVRPPSTLDDDSFDVQTTMSKQRVGPRTNLTGAAGAQYDDELPPTPVCAELPKSVKIMRHRPHTGGGDCTPVMLHMNRDSDCSVDESLGATPQLSSPPASLALLQAARERRLQSAALPSLH